MQQLRRQLHEKEWALQDVTEACDAEKAAFEKAQQATEASRDAHLEEALRVKTQLKELSHLVEQLKQVRRRAMLRTLQHPLACDRIGPTLSACL